jgi:hypothetical protein
VSFEVYRKEAEARSKDALALTLADVLVGEAAIDPHLYPDAVEIRGAKVPLSYVFDPHEDADGITAQIPESLVPQLRPGELDFTVPGWQKEQFFHLFHGLPKAIKGKLGSIPELAAAEPVLVVARSAVVDVAGKSVVFVEDSPGSYTRHDVTLGLSAPGKVQVLGGLREGEAVVVAGVFTLKSVLLKGSMAEDD